MVSQNFDFNKLFKDGIPYLRSCEEARIRENINERQSSRRSTGNFATPTNTGFTPVPDDQKEFIDKIYEQVEKWLKDENNKEQLKLDSCNAFQRRLIYNNVKPRFSEDYSFHMETVVNPNKERCIHLTKGEYRTHVRYQYQSKEANVNHQPFS